MNTELSLEKQEQKEILPFSPKNLWMLFLQPKTFFSLPAIYHHRSIMIAAYLIGVFSVMDRVDQKLLQAEFGNRTSLMLDITDAWWSYWLLVLGLGTISAVIVWLIHGWWYKKRLQFSGAKDADPQLARHIWALQSLVTALPVMIVTILQTLMYSSYLDAYQNSSILNLVVIPFIFWSCWVSYRAATSVFNTNGWAKFWFLAFPITFYVLAMGLFTALVVNA
ncbi:hypothetical protein MMO38_09105 [Acinetobacter sp. NIPH 1852]|uniref:hypothetical protein n=1 Tax=Acinetobacter sp. NIPH 1852 TaxID=2923428 RepID=UPI001F4ADCA9|nr:hypothetical protein [Acinetobacter sp. NIPH 1852]MCH7308295.1 hypothetical protein [Acinetobacter sp. NIPH 1852]